MARQKKTATGGYKRRLEARGLTRTPQMRWTGWSTDQIVRHFATLPHYRWILITHGNDGVKLSSPFQRRVEIR